MVWAWIDEKPVWLSPVDWYLEILPSPDAPIQRRFRLSLLGGGQITVIEHFEPWGWPDPPAETICFRTDLRVTADTGKSLQRFAGALDDSVSYEMGAKAVLFRSGTPQDIADRVAATFRLLTFADGVGTSVRGPDAENFAALLDRGSQCCVSIGRCAIM